MTAASTDMVAFRDGVMAFLEAEPYPIYGFRRRGDWGATFWHDANEFQAVPLVVEKVNDDTITQAKQLAAQFDAEHTTAEFASYSVPVLCIPFALRAQNPADLLAAFKADVDVWRFDGTQFLCQELTWEQIA